MLYLRQGSLQFAGITISLYLPFASAVESDPKWSTGQ
jgi:hypothetical protein